MPREMIPRKSLHCCLIKRHPSTGGVFFSIKFTLLFVKNTNIFVYCGIFKQQIVEIMTKSAHQQHGESKEMECRQAFQYHNPEGIKPKSQKLFKDLIDDGFHIVTGQPHTEKTVTLRKDKVTIKISINKPKN